MNTIAAFSRAASVLIAATVLAASGPLHSEESKPLPVVASFGIVADWVQQVGGDRVQVQTLVPRGADPHSFEPSPRQVAQFEAAKLVFLIGASMEPGIEALSGRKPTGFIALAPAIGIKAEGDHGHDHAHGDEKKHGHGHDHAHGDEKKHGHDHAHAHSHDHHHHHHDVDPHIWTSVVKARAAVLVVRDALIAADPAGASVYQANWAAYDLQLADLHAEIEALVQTIPEARRRLVTTHDSLGYFAEAYGFTVVGTVLGTHHSDVADPPPRQIAQLVAAIREAQVPVIFPETTVPNRLLQTVAREAGVWVGPALSADNLGPAAGPTGSYLGLMRHLAQTITTALLAE
ncbi:MAG: zinc ABC transporter substrate-binding protein [Planctomycetota bacterium]|nr:MAG: zinc ABC transporter substrate-binding protein [Planctomycetota bacterium]